MEKSIEELIYEETEQRLKKWVQSLVISKKANKADYIGIVVAAGVPCFNHPLCMAEAVV